MGPVNYDEITIGVNRACIIAVVEKSNMIAGANLSNVQRSLSC